MNLQKLKDQLIVHEGLKLKAYTDTVGKITIGVGHNITDLGLTKSQVLGILDDDVANTLKFLDTQPWFLALDEVRQRAIADMTFNLMEKILQFHGMIAALNSKDWNAAADHLLGSLFAHQVGKRAEDLAKMIRTGQDAV